MSKYIKESFNFKDNVPFIFREMGADPEMYKKNNNEKEFDIVYCGRISNKCRNSLLTHDFIRKKLG